MFSFLRTVRSIGHSHLSRNENLRVYKVKVVQRSHVLGSVLGLATVTTAWTITSAYTSSPNGKAVETMFGGRDIMHIPIGLVQQIESEPYSPDGPEVKAYRKFIMDPKA